MELFKNSKINDEIDAYIFGFIYADGYLTSRKNDTYYALGITLSRKDEEYLKTINNYINGKISTSNVSLKQTNKIYETVEIMKCSVSFVKTLIGLGISPKKTHLNQRIWEHIQPSLYNHFIRGFFDGDGTICMGNSDKKYRCGFVGKNQILFEWLSEVLSEKLNKKVNYNLDKSSNCFRIQLSGNPSCKNFGNYIYDNSTLFLKRKKDLFDNIPLKIQQPQPLNLL